MELHPINHQRARQVQLLAAPIDRADAGGLGKPCIKNVKEVKQRRFEGDYWRADNCGKVTGRANR
jgi:hypothetical protein